MAILFKAEYNKQEIKKKIGGLGNHYGWEGYGYQNLKIQIIDQVKVRDCRALEEAEVYWQNQLRVYIQNGGQHLDCDSQFVIYLGTCQKYKGQYVGKSQTPFKKQHSNHKLEIKKKIGSLGNHYGGEGCGYQNLKNQLLIKLK